MNPNLEIQEVYSRRIGGWLILYLIMTMVSTAFYLWGLLHEIIGFKDLGNAFVSINLIGILLMLVLSVFILMMFISKKASARKTVMFFEGFCAVMRLIGIAGMLLSNLIFPKSYFVSLLFVIVSVVWILYFWKSTRVKETFIN